MSEVKYYHVSDTGLAEGTSLGRITVVLAADFDNATRLFLDAAERCIAAECREAELREELAIAKRVGPPHFCGLPMSLNPHPEAGVPGRFLEVGTVSECIPCLVSSRHGWAKTAGDLQQRLTAAEQRNSDTIAKLELAASMMDDDERGNRFAEVCRLAIKSLKPTESGASE